MPQAPIAIIAAMPEETEPLRRAFSAQRQPASLPVFRGRVGQNDIIIIQSGMGRTQAAHAMEMLFRMTIPRLVISCGVGGAVRSGLKVGDVVVATDIYLMERESLTTSTAEITTARGGIAGTVITTDVIRTKSAVNAAISGTIGNPVLDMETFAIAEAAQKAGIPVMAIRSISDDAGEELQFSLDEFTDKQLKLRLCKVAATIIKKPYIIPQLLRLARNTKLAAQSLALYLKDLLEESDRRI